MVEVSGLATITFRYTVHVDVEDITTRSMSIEESDELIKNAIADKYKKYVDEISVETIKKHDEHS